MRWLAIAALMLAVPAHAERFGVQVGDVPPVVVTTPASWRMGRGPHLVPLLAPLVLRAAPGVASAVPMPPDVPRAKPDRKVLPTPATPRERR